MKKHLLTCAVVLSLIVGTFLIVFTFENVVFALAGIHFLSTSSLDRSNFMGSEVQQRIDLDRSTIAVKPQESDQIRHEDADQDVGPIVAVAEIAQAATH